MNLVKSMPNTGSVRKTTSGTPAPAVKSVSNSKVNKASSMVRSSSSAKGGAYMKKAMKKTMKKSRKSRRN